jgi:Holliday junction resolvase RusA-like endonuclease
MIELYSFYFNVEPKAYADSTRFTKQGFAYKPKEVKEYQKKLLSSFHMDLPYKEGTFPIDGPLLAAWVFYMPRIKKNTNTDQHSYLHHSVKPDVDNLTKLTQDCIQYEQFSEKKSKRTLTRLGLITNDSRISVSISEKLYVRKNQQPKIRLILCPLKQIKRELPLTAVFLNALASES